MKSLILIGYSGHAFVCIELAEQLNYNIIGYCDFEEKKYNPYNLSYLGKDTDSKNIDLLKINDFFIGIGNNQIRRKIIENLTLQISKQPVSLISTNSIISHTAKISNFGILVMPSATINALSIIGNGVICNTGCTIEHECQIGDFAHIAPGAVLCGNVTIGEMTFVGANSVVKQGVTIGRNVTIGAGSVIVKNIPDNVTVVGNPARIIKTHTL